MSRFRRFLLGVPSRRRTAAVAATLAGTLVLGVLSLVSPGVVRTLEASGGLWALALAALGAAHARLDNGIVWTVALVALLQVTLTVNGLYAGWTPAGPPDLPTRLARGLSLTLVYVAAPALVGFAAGFPSRRYPD